MFLSITALKLSRITYLGSYTVKALHFIERILAYYLIVKALRGEGTEPLASLPANLAAALKTLAVNNNAANYVRLTTVRRTITSSAVVMDAPGRVIKKTATTPDDSMILRVIVLQETGLTLVLSPAETKLVIVTIEPTGCVSQLTVATPDIDAWLRRTFHDPSDCPLQMTFSPYSMDNELQDRLIAECNRFIDGARRLEKRLS